MVRRRVLLAVAVTVGLASLASRPAGAQVPPARRAEPVDAYQVRLSPSGASLLGPDGALLLELSPELLLAAGAPAERPDPRLAPLRTERLRLGPWQVQRRSSTGFLLIARASAGPLRYSLELEGRAGWLELRLESEAVEARAVRDEVLQLRGGPSLAATVVDRSLRWVPARGPSHAGILDVQGVRLAAAGGARLTLLGGPGQQGLWVRPGRDGRALLELELDHEENHPFHPLLGCTRRQIPIKHGSLGATLRPAGSRRLLRAMLLVGETMLPLVARFPRGARAALVLTDHADQSNAPKLEALACGATGAVEAGRRGPQHPGLVNRGLAYTKSIFLRRVHGYAQQLESPAYRGLLERLQRGGVELAMHSVSGGPDRRERLRKLLPEFRALSAGQTWIDHQPATNCEALSNQGWDRRSRYHVVDLLVQAGLRHFWSGEDVTRLSGSLNLLAPEQPGSRRPLLYPFAQRPAGDLWLFTSTPFFVDRTAFVSALGDEGALRRLEQEHGLFIGHVYLDTFQRPGERFSERSLLQFGDGPRRYRLRPEVDEVFQRLAAHQTAGRLWVCGVDALIDHLGGRAAVELRPGAQPGELLVSSHAPRRLSGLTLRLPAGAAKVTVDGAPAAVEKPGEAAGERVVWFDLEPGASRRLRLQGRAARPAGLLLREEQVHHE